MANAEEIAEQFLMEIAMLRPARRTFALLTDFVYHQLISLNNDALANDVLEILVHRIEQEFLQPQQQLASPMIEPQFPQLPPSPTASTISIVSSQTIDEPEMPPPLTLEEPAPTVQYIPVIPVIPCFIDPHQVYHVTLPIAPPPQGYVNPTRSILRTQLASFYHSTPVMIKSSSFDIHVEYQTITAPESQTCPTNGEVQ